MDGHKDISIVFCEMIALSALCSFCESLKVLLLLFVSIPSSPFLFLYGGTSSLLKYRFILFPFCFWTSCPKAFYFHLWTSCPKASYFHLWSYCPQVLKHKKDSYKRFSFITALSLLFFFFISSIFLGTRNTLFHVHISYRLPANTNTLS